MIHKTGAEHERASVVGEIQKRRDSIAQELEQLIAELETEYKHAENILNQNPDDKSSIVDSRWMFRHEYAYENENKQAEEGDEIVWVF